MKFRQTWTAVRALLILTLALGVGYPLIVTGIGQLAFNSNANGQLVRVNGEVIGSAVIGQSFTDPMAARSQNGFSRGHPRPAPATTGAHPAAPTTVRRTSS